MTRLHLPSFLTGAIVVGVVAHHQALTTLLSATMSVVEPNGTLDLALRMSTSAVLLIGGAVAMLITRRETRSMSLWPAKGQTDFAALQKGIFPFVESGTSMPAPLSVREFLLASGCTPFEKSIVSSETHASEVGIVRDALEAQLTPSENALPEHRRAVGLLLALGCGTPHDSGQAYVAWRDSLARAYAPERTPQDIEKELDSLMIGLYQAVRASPFALKAIETTRTAHAWTETMLMGLLRLARKHRNVTCAEFGWLQRIDRPLFFALNSVGRPSALPEGLGAAAHFNAELAAGHALADKHIEDAVIALFRADWLRPPSNEAS